MMLVDEEHFYSLLSDIQAIEDSIMLISVEYLVAVEARRHQFKLAYPSKAPFRSTATM